MHMPISQPNTRQQLDPIAAENRLLELFAPTLRPLPAVTYLPGREHAELWRADAIHRAKNLSQMTSSLANVADRPSRRWLPAEVTAQARRLARAYDELGVDEYSQAGVPCAALLSEIATRLADIFGRSRQIAVTICAEPILLPANVRRALLLVASELIINALKYAYPSGAGGTIAVSLAARHGGVELTVEDDGIGLDGSCSAGQGGRLLERLQSVLCATVTRATAATGHGLRVSTLVAIDMAKAGSA